MKHRYMMSVRLVTGRFPENTGFDCLHRWIRHSNRHPMTNTKSVQRMVDSYLAYIEIEMLRQTGIRSDRGPQESVSRLLTGIRSYQVWPEYTKSVLSETDSFQECISLQKLPLILIHTFQMMLDRSLAFLTFLGMSQVGTGSIQSVFQHQLSQNGFQSESFV